VVSLRVFPLVLEEVEWMASSSARDPNFKAYPTKLPCVAPSNFHWFNNKTENRTLGLPKKSGKFELSLHKYFEKRGGDWWKYDALKGIRSIHSILEKHHYYKKKSSRRVDFSVVSQLYWGSNFVEIEMQMHEYHAEDRFPKDSSGFISFLWEKYHRYKKKFPHQKVSYVFSLLAIALSSSNITLWISKKKIRAFKNTFISF
jgi:hypothetical protein